MVGIDFVVLAVALLLGAVLLYWLARRRVRNATDRMIKGVVSGFQQRNEQIWTVLGPRFITVWDFRIERQDPAGKLLPRVAVQMRGRSFTGSINNNDVVEINGTVARGEIMQTRRVHNLTTGAEVHAKRVTRYWLPYLASALIVLTIFTIIVVVMFTFLPQLLPR